MSITLENAQIELSKQLGDFWNSTTTSEGSTTAVIDTALKAKANDWIADAPQEMMDRITSGTYDNEERKISSLDNTSGTLTTLAHGGTIATAVTYEVHRLFSASEKRRALIYAARHSYPSLFSVIKNESLSVGNWLRNGDVEIWASSSYPDYWRVSAVTATKTSTAKCFKRGAYSCALSTAAGYLYQDWTYSDDLKELRGKTVTFTAQGYSSVASSLRLAIYDGITTTYSDYHAGSSVWTQDDTPLKVQATISEDATDVAFRVYYASGTCYVDDLRVYTPNRDKLYLGDLGLVNNRPHRISQSYDVYSQYEPWEVLHKWDVDKDGYLYLQEGTTNNRLRVEGIGYLDFLASGVSSELWTAAIDITTQQLDILVAEAIMYLYVQMISPNYTAGERNNFSQMLKYWAAELDERRAKYGMISPKGTVKY